MVLLFLVFERDLKYKSPILFNKKIVGTKFQILVPHTWIPKLIFYFEQKTKERGSRERILESSHFQN